jgi:AcrR family transcriptional regulator
MASARKPREVQPVRRPKSPSERPRTALNRDRILDAALALVDKGGLESLSMRKLGQSLGVEAMSLYNHVANKDDVIGGILDRVAYEIEAPSATDEWDAAIRKSALSAHQALRRHPWAPALMMSPSHVVPERIRYMEGLLGTLRRAGFSSDMTYHAYHVLDAHIFGFSLWQAGHAAAAKDLPKEFESTEDFIKWLVQRFPPEEYPHVAEHGRQHFAEGPHQEVSAFEISLDLILDGLKRELEAA